MGAMRESTHRPVRVQALLHNLRSCIRPSEEYLGHDLRWMIATFCLLSLVNTSFVLLRSAHGVSRIEQSDYGRQQTVWPRVQFWHSNSEENIGFLVIWYPNFNALRMRLSLSVRTPLPQILTPRDSCSCQGPFPLFFVSISFIAFSTVHLSLSSPNHPKSTVSYVNSMAPNPIYQQTKLKTLYFSTTSRRPLRISLPTLISPSGKRFPVVSTTLRGYTTIPVKKVRVSIRDDENDQYRFTVYFRHDQLLGVNGAAGTLAPFVPWTGDFIVIQEGYRYNYIGLASWYAYNMAHRAARVFLDHAHECIQAAGGEDAFSVIFPTQIDEPQAN
ncbi:uncharacterized protein LACBIDRAFT_330349 [Laccaria bicolor S238N-H82]|uniref:Predicted protein n=1 Tax=Laccaria bicolor (strain S238N-H82 / ATCC MYA-4686) TaxID=486041 RepID=B0DL10_LACBS|nr:uncharacterized protein LACBIDRAFT_330349 [Laccaria bicolor S238N-H82]EDR04743.1 predicted protein [Laccaria bicolor S238N-H82]|eukprot:XP_001884567.1 predicted protein [Laccaria bicolor S238N-H82]